MDIKGKAKFISNLSTLDLCHDSVDWANVGGNPYIWMTGMQMMKADHVVEWYSRQWRDYYNSRFTQCKEP